MTPSGYVPFETALEDVASVHGPDRAQARAALVRALADKRVRAVRVHRHSMECEAVPPLWWCSDAAKDIRARDSADYQSMARGETFQALASVAAIINVARPGLITPDPLIVRCELEAWLGVPVNSPEPAVYPAEWGGNPWAQTAALQRRHMSLDAIRRCLHQIHEAAAQLGCKPPNGREEAKLVAEVAASEGLLAPRRRVEDVAKEEAFVTQRLPAGKHDDRHALTPALLTKFRKMQSGT